MRNLVFGHGYLGSRVAGIWLQRGDQVVSVTRSGDRATQLCQQGFAAVIADVTEPESLRQPALAGPFDNVLFAVGHDRTAGRPILDVYAGGLRNVLSVICNARRFVSISSTGVYGNANGEWVDEQTVPAPARDGGKASLAAERVLLGSPLADRGVVLRLAGIYGPDRLPYLKLIESGEPIPALQAGWLNLIHVDDAARIVVAACDLENVSQLYCVSDGAPVVRRDYYSEAAALIGANPPSFVDPPPDSPRAARAAADKRVSNQKMLRELNQPLEYPSYREGLAHILGNPRPSG